jgi:hypothetical protein
MEKKRKREISSTPLFVSLTLFLTHATLLHSFHDPEL